MSNMFDYPISLETPFFWFTSVELSALCQIFCPFSLSLTWRQSQWVQKVSLSLYIYGDSTESKTTKDHLFYNKFGSGVKYFADAICMVWFTCFGRYMHHEKHGLLIQLHLNLMQAVKMQMSIEGLDPNLLNLSDATQSPG